MEYKLTSINKIQNNRTLGLKDKVLLQEIDNKAKKSMVGFHPKIKSSNPHDNKFSIRMEEWINLKYFFYLMKYLNILFYFFFLFQ